MPCDNYSNWFGTDEPASEDGLDREQIAKELASIAMGCGTPMVIGIYGGWGSGKTSLMNLMRKHIDATVNHNRQVKTVWFNPWEYQFTENIAVLLVSAIAKQCDVFSEEWVRGLLGKTATLTGAFAGMLPGFSGARKGMGDLAQMVMNQMEQELAIKSDMKKAIEKALTKVKNGSSQPARLIVFIDDLDRCVPEQTRGLLEALKLYLTHEGCVYVVGADSRAVEASVEDHYRTSSSPISGAEYLEKIVQIPYRLPGLSMQTKKNYLDNLLPVELRPCAYLLMTGLSASPREMKRFILLLKMNYLTGSTVGGYRVAPAAFILLIQWIDSEIFQKIGKNRGLMLQLVEESENGLKAREEHLGHNSVLKKVFEAAMNKSDVPRDVEEVDLYLHLARLVLGEDEDTWYGDTDFVKVHRRHKEWLLSGGVRGVQANLLRAQYHKEKWAEIQESLKGQDDSEIIEVETNNGKTTIIKINLARAYLFGIFMEGADLSHATLYGANMEEAALSYIIFNHANMERVNLDGADLKGAFFKNTRLTKARFWLADLSNAQLDGAYLVGVNLGGANLEEACFDGANLGKANLKGANIDRATFDGCDLSMAYLKGVRGNHVQIAEALSKAKSLYGATLPNDEAYEKLKKSKYNLFEMPKELKKKGDDRG